MCLILTENRRLIRVLEICRRQDRRRKERNGGGKKNERRFFVVLIADEEKEGCHFSLYYNRRQAGE